MFWDLGAGVSATCRQPGPGREVALREPYEIRLVLGVTLILNSESNLTQLVLLWPQLGRGKFRQEPASILRQEGKRRHEALIGTPPS